MSFFKILCFFVELMKQRLIVFITQYALANSREERRNLYLVLFDYVLHQINEKCIATGISEYSDDEIQPLATLLALADAPEAFFISVKLGVQGIGGILRRSISDALARYPNSERLNMVCIWELLWCKLSHSLINKFMNSYIQIFRFAASGKYY